MKSTTLFLTIVLLITFNHNAIGQQFTGPNNSTSEINRTGQVGIGLADSPNDTQLYVKSNNLKVGIVSETTHNIDFQFGILSAVNRSNTKALSVLLKNGSNYVDKFAVMGDGNVLATEVKVLTNIFPDYVFEKDYELLSFQELENFIEKNKRLPNIPSAEEVIKDGIALGDMQVKQMEKIEELTLYIIELNKKIEALGAEVNDLKNDNDE